MNLKGFVKTNEKLRNYRKETWRKQLKSTEKLLVMNKGRRKSSDEQLSLASLFLFCAIKKHRFISAKISLFLAGFFLKLFGRAKKKEKLPNCDPRMLKMSCIIRQGRPGFLGIYGIQGLFKSGIQYIAVKRRVFGLSLSLNFRYT